jgi:hypothetical protein
MGLARQLIFGCFKLLFESFSYLGDLLLGSGSEQLKVTSQSFIFKRNCHCVFNVLNNIDITSCSIFYLAFPSS